jgi:MATE family multidrug resistance protein
MSFVDTAMVGRLGAAALGGVGIGNGIFFALTVVGIGCVMGMDAPAAQALGARDEAEARRVLWQGVRVAIAAGVPLTALVALAPFVLRPAGVDPATAREAGRFLVSRAPNVLPLLLFVAARSYLQAKGVTRPIVYATVVANISNFIGNSLLIYGDRALVRVGLPPLGLPALGVAGSGLSSSIAATLSLAIVAAALAALPAPPDPDRRRGSARRVALLLALGAPVGLQMLAEVGVFALVSVLAGRMSPTAAAGHQVAITLASFTFTVTIGIASAAAVRVGHRVGEGDTRAARHAGFVALRTGAAFMAGAALLFFAAPAALARILTNDAGVIAQAVPLVLIAALFQISDGIQSVGAGVLRGAGDNLVPLFANLVGHYAIGLPVAIALGFGLGMGPSGLWWGLLAGLTAVAIGLFARFERLSSRPILTIRKD